MKPFRLLVVVENGFHGAGPMVRAYQYKDMLAARGVDAVFVSRRPALLARLESRLVGGRALAAFGVRWVRRLSRFLGRLREPWIARRARGFDAVYLVLVPRPALYRRLAGMHPRPALFMDVVDNLWRPNASRPAWRNFREMPAWVDAVICENPFVAGRMRELHARVYVAPDAPQVEDFDRRRAFVAPDPERITLGWVGSPSTCGSLYAAFEALERLFARHPGRLHLRLVGADPSRLPPFEEVSYSCVRTYDQATMVDEVLAMDIGIFPQFDTEEARARGSLKAMVYMSGGVAAVCQDLGENRALIEDGRNGLLARTPGEWLSKLELLVLDAERRRAIAAEGLRTVRKGYTRERRLDALLEALRDGMESRHGR